MHNTIILSIFNTEEDSNEAVDALKKNGLSNRDISIIFKENERRDPLKENTKGGAATGGVIGGIAGLLVGIGAIVILGIGPALVAGPLISLFGITGAAIAATATTTISGGVLGALAGGLVGALVGLGLSPNEAQELEAKVKEGAVLLAIHTTEKAEETIKQILANHHSSDIKVIEVEKIGQEAGAIV